MIDFGCIKQIPDSFYEPYYSLMIADTLTNKEKTIDAFKKLEMILPKDTPQQVEFYYNAYKEMIALFAMPYTNETFDFSNEGFFESMYNFGDKLAKMPEFKQARGVKHFIYVNRTNFGLYTILHDLKAVVKTDKYKPVL